MKKRFIRILSLILAVSVLAACLGLSAGAVTLEAKSISVSSGIKITVDGSEFIPVDSEGVPVEVFLYNGTTYLPVRGISNLFGLGIEWDGESKSVYLGTRGGSTLPAYSGTAGVSTTPFAYESKSITVFTGASIYYNDEYFVPTGSDGEIVEVFIYNGTTYLPVRAISNLMNAGIDWDQANKTVIIETGAGDAQAIVEAAAEAAKIYTDAGSILLPYYQYYLKVATVLSEYAQTYRAQYELDPDTYLETYFTHASGYSAFDKQFGTYMENSISYYEFAKTLTTRIETYAEGGYTAEELETLATNTEYLSSNQSYYSEHIAASTPELILQFVADSFNSEVVTAVSAIEI